jgi:hypothetical protein
MRIIRLAITKIMNWVRFTQCLLLALVLRRGGTGFISHFRKNKPM